MQIARVVGTVVATQKNRKLEGAKLLLVQPITPDGEPRGGTFLTIDSVGAGVGETPAGHASHYRYVLPESDGPCLIEPTVQCNHCGFCQSHGH